ncbi:putative ATP-dependent DEAD/H RNA helicase [Trypanosoma cruzi]|uniref:ATP-dependent RNA helicase n=2 Tax=Trypanosoma cruzi TaxID=5693 RepID=Q4D7K2_TRYCC|nr:ATP-dependent DEAD/H RNA helicase, putative [Trypanosoma cruzi]EAN88493.1 ATP-dependent DEAD/H RNA helicase, putative [Trypanosoma cruzi]PWU96394.1 putative ATP-dependent DEAD/H RNA helicase [Trypanosoma cruzi]RNC41525.1 DEAD-box helicase-like protein [Trypanosoma cruzi]|eukprot:XP_810344.1 ATP-dependent DEAD/H RNA helicase [Trypanosoma cruzi strain CL Brener]
MSLAEMDAQQHLAVLGLSKCSENDTLDRLLAGAERGPSVDLNDWGDGCDLCVDAPSQPSPAARAAPVMEDKSEPKRLKRKRTSTLDAEEDEFRSKATAESRAFRGQFPAFADAPLKNKNIPPSSSLSTVFEADKACVDAESLPPLNELVHSKLLRPLTECLHITSLTCIQKQSWTPMVDRTRDVLLRSETGSGKTLAYALPLLHQLLCECDARPIQRQIGSIIIVLCPTRELVVQVTDVLSVLARCALFLTVGGIHGGENRHKEKARLRKGVPLLIATPGRLLDHLRATVSFCVASTQTIVLDEADRLLDMGFERAIKEIMGLLLEKTENSACSCDEIFTETREKYTLKRVLVSATITAEVERLSHFALRSNVVRVGETEDTFSIPSSLRQHYALVPIKHRLSTLIGFLRSQIDAGAQRIIVFVSTADSAEFHYRLLSRLQSPFCDRRKEVLFKGASKQNARQYGVKRRVEEANRHVQNQSEAIVTFEDDSGSEDDNDEGQTLSGRNALLDVNILKLHGNMSQVDRASVFKAFKHVGGAARRSLKGVLFCTDVAARGLDMPRVDWIVHYDPPTDPACYVHRIGRTARIGNVGDSLLFLMPHEAGYVPYLSKFIAKESGSSFTGNEAAAVVATMEKRNYESFLYYLAKLDPKSNHIWMQSTATLERAISRLVMNREEPVNELPAGDASRNDDLTRLALFAYQSYIRAYAGHSRELKTRFFNLDMLHLGHIAHSFGLDKRPSEVRAQLQNLIMEDRKIAREASSLNTQERVRGCDGSRVRRRLQVEVRHDDRYRSMIVQKQRKVTRDWFQGKKDGVPKNKTLQFTEFDA